MVGGKQGTPAPAPEETEAKGWGNKRGDQPIHLGAYVSLSLCVCVCAYACMYTMHVKAVHKHTVRAYISDSHPRPCVSVATQTHNTNAKHKRKRKRKCKCK